jgi:hypothetical protein
MAVFWTIQAKRHLRQALAESLCHGRCGSQTQPGACGPPDVLEQTMDRLNDLLAATFPGASVVVKDQFLVYRRKQDRFILMVEAFGAEGSGACGPFVVKIGPETRLMREIEAWSTCRPAGLKHDMVFLELNESKPLTFDDMRWMSLVYGDAQQFLGVSETKTFEAAALDSVLSGLPKLLSIVFVINSLFERIGHLLYNQAFVDDPARESFVFDLPKLDRSLTRWETEPSCKSARVEVNSLAKSGAERFLDPADYLRYVQKHVAHTVLGPDDKVEVRPAAVGAQPAPDWGLPRPAVTALVPRMLRGCAHGDLHGRNILVGIVRDQALWPTVFDYEDMSPCNLIGWDFAKLETELKLRAFLDVFGGGNSATFIRRVQEFEIALAVETESCHTHRTWPEVHDSSTPEARLRAVLLAIRRMAAQHLGLNLGRPNDWLEEYYFLLSCYGVSTGWFDNLQPRERVGALTAAGVAAARLTWPRSVA